MRSTRLVISCSKLKNNIAELKKELLPTTHLMAIVKANAYGHGVLDTARYSLKYGADWLGVATPEEGVYLRENGITAPVLVLGAANGEELELCVSYELHQTVFDIKTVREIDAIAQRLGKTAYAHIKINSGMNRIGISDKTEFERLIEEVKSSKALLVDGIFTHFATADEEDCRGTAEQIARFEAMLDTAEQNGMSFEYIHACNSAGIMKGICPKYNMVRLGIGLYGYYPSEYVKKTSSAKIKPIAEFVTNISAVNVISAGETVSYGATFRADREMRIATLPVGYADGYNRLLSNRGKVIINGKLADVVGRVCMDQMMVDITDIPEAHEGTEAVLIGERQGICVDADDIADMCRTVSYEVLTSIAQRVERVFVEA